MTSYTAVDETELSVTAGEYVTVLIDGPDLVFCKSDRGVILIVGMCYV